VLLRFGDASLRFWFAGGESFCQTRRSRTPMVSEGTVGGLRHLEEATATGMIPTHRFDMNGSLRPTPTRGPAPCTGPAPQ